jgi:hypothetical protein
MPSRLFLDVSGPLAAGKPIRNRTEGSGDPSKAFSNQFRERSELLNPKNRLRERSELDCGPLAGHGAACRAPSGSMTVYI